MLIYPFMDKDILINIFGKDLYMNDKLEGLGDLLLDEKQIKPFECVGTREELKAALFLASEKQIVPSQKLLLLLKAKYVRNVKLQRSKVEALLDDWNRDNNLPPVFDQLLQKTL